MEVEEIDRIRADLESQLVDGDPRYDPSMDAGRNLRAGYVRGIGIEFGKLRPVIETDPDWMAALAVARDRTIVPHYRLMNIFLIIKYSNILTGNIIEFGAYKGGSAIFMAVLAQRFGRDCKVFALDTFSGIPQIDTHLDRHHVGGFVDGDYEGLLRARDDLKLDNLVVLQGSFADTVGQIEPRDRKFFLSHIDCDVYDAVRFALRYVKQHAVTGSYVICDDPLTADCLGSMKAVEEELIMLGCHTEQMYPHLVFRYPPIL